jgi:endoglucanase
VFSKQVYHQGVKHYLPSLIQQEKTMMFTDISFATTKKSLITLLLLLIAEAVLSQPEVPIKVLQAKFMSIKSSCVSYNDAYALINCSNAYVRESVSFPASASYRFDLSAYSYYVGNLGQAQIRIDGKTAGTIQVSDTITKMYSTTIKVTAGVHNVDILNVKTGAGFYAGLLYITKTTAPAPYVYPPIKPLTLVPNQILTANHFGSGILRGFNLGSNNLTANDMMSMKATGANIARYFIAVSKIPGTNTYSCNKGELDKSDSAVARAKRYDYYVIPTLQVFPEDTNEDFWGTSATAVSRRESLINIWKDLAKRYKGNAAVAAYNLINEPRNNRNYAEWIAFASQLIQAIRQIDPAHVIIVEYSYTIEMFTMMQPLPYTNLVYSPHFYDPLKITHQGVQGEDAIDRIPYPKLIAGNTMGTYTKINLSKELNPARTLAKTYNVPIFIGEFSCVNWAPINDNGIWTSSKWIDDEISLFEAEKWTWCYHAWREWEGWDAEIPSSFYLPYRYENATPTGFTSSQQRAARTPSAPSITKLKKWFKLNAQVN